jgi:hypothetical protein
MHAVLLVKGHSNRVASTYIGMRCALKAPRTDTARTACLAKNNRHSCALGPTILLYDPGKCSATPPLALGFHHSSQENGVQRCLHAGLAACKKPQTLGDSP